MSEITAASEALRKRLRRQEATTLRDVATLHREAVAALRRELLAVTARIMEAATAGDAVSDAWLYREARYRALVAQAEATYARFAQAAGRTITTAQIDVVAVAQDDVRRLVLASIGPAPVGAVLPLSVLPQGSLLELAGTLSPGSPLRGLLDGYGQRVAATIEREFIGGIATGRNPRDVARRIVRQVGNGERARLLTTARTEMLRSHREAMRRSMQANSRIVKGWRWSAARDTRTCLACLAMDGRVFKLERPMPAHPSCRCSLLPVTASWRDLGYDVADLPPPETGRAWFARQPSALQQSMLGERAFAAYAAGDLDISAFVGYRRSKQWGPSVTQRPVGQALTASQKKGPTQIGQSAVASPRAPRFTSIPEAEGWLRQNITQQVVLGKHDLGALQSLIDGMAEGLIPFNVRLNLLDLTTVGKGPRLVGLYRGTTEMVGGKIQAIGKMFFHPTKTSTAKRMQATSANTREVFQANKAREIATIEKRLASPSLPAPLRVDNENRLARQHASKRWSVSSDAADPIKAVAAHESGHAVYYAKGLGDVWERGVRALPPGEQITVSEYGASSSVEFFAEAFAMRILNMPLPPSIDRLLREVLNDAV